MPLIPKILSVAFSIALAGSAAAANSDSPAVGRALSLIDSHGSAVRASGQDKFTARDAILDSEGTEHVRFDRSYRGLSVIGGDFVTHSRNGKLLSVSLTQGFALNLGTRPVLNASDAIVAAGDEFGSSASSPSAELVVYARGASPNLAYRVAVQNDDASMTYIVDAMNGKLLDSWSNLQTAAATGNGRTLYSGNVAVNTDSTANGFEMRDTEHGNSYTTDFNNGSINKPGPGTIFTDADNDWGNNQPSSRQSAGADAHFGVSKTWEFYAILGRNGIDGAGRQSYNRVHMGRNYVNAFWSDSCFCMSYGDGDGRTYGPLVDLDVAGHEMSHGVTSESAGLIYSGESGGLNEASSDIMGSMVEFYVGSSVDTPDYLIGEEMYIANVSGSANQKALRYMYRPSKDGSSADCWYSTLSSLDVHYSSGPANHFFYLLAEGTGAKDFSGVDHTPSVCKAGDTKSGTGTGSLTGIGRDAATRIWYRALTVYMTSNTNYAQAKAATQSAAADLYPGDATIANAVDSAWAMVNL